MGTRNFDITTLPDFEAVRDRSLERERERVILEEHHSFRPGQVFASPDVATFRFANGYGGWVLMGDAEHPACGVSTADEPFEMAVFHTDTDGDHLCYATPITSDVICPLDATDVAATLGIISRLPRQAGCDHGKSPA